ncbi:SpoIIE family protein phosphatase [Streptomyces sp. FL06-04B]|nr:SpoIIE family protein phosphatase [Streptomyces sp. FL06-04B]
MLPGDTLLLYTDGLTEARTGPGLRCTGGGCRRGAAGAGRG